MAITSYPGETEFDKFEYMVMVRCRQSPSPYPNTLPEPCWLWPTGTKLGYVYFYWRGGQEYIHRVAYRLFIGRRIPKGMVVDHRCHRRNCVEPTHLQVLSRRANSGLHPKQRSQIEN